VHIRPLAVIRRSTLTPGAMASTAGRALLDCGGLSRLARGRRAVLVHSNTSVIVAAGAAARLAGVPHVAHVREIYAGWARGWPAWRSALVAGASTLACVSAATRAQFAPGAPARVVLDALPPRPGPLERARARALLGLAPDAFVCAVLGRISPWKGQAVLARALAQPALRDRAAVGLVAGDVWPGEESRETLLRAEATRCGLGERWRMLGYREDIETVLGAADVVVVPSTRPEPLGNSALEAAAAGRCLVVAAHGGLPEIVAEGRTGRLVAPDDPAGLARILDELAGDPAQRERLGRAAAADVRERFAPARLVDAVEEIYREVLGQG